MLALAGIATLAFILAGTSVGIRLLRLAKRTQGKAERNVGLGLLLICGLAYPLSLSLQVDAIPETVRRFAFAIAMFSLAGGAIAITEFVRGVFRSEVPWARWLTVASCAAWFAMTGWGIWAAVSQPIESIGSTEGLRFILRQLLMLGVFGWTAVEAGLYWLKMRRRRAIGLAEPEVINRFALWCISGTMSVVSSSVMTVTGLAGINPSQDPTTLLVTGLGGLVSSAALVLAFLPPKSYLAWIRASV